MDAVNELKFSRSLFMQENGVPLSFHMRPGFERKLIKPIIEKGGGTVSCWHSSGAIKLCADSDRSWAGNEVRSRYIIDCAKANKLLDMSLYRCSTSPGEDDLAPSSLITTSRRHMRGRQKYTEVDDKKIVSYLVNEQRYSEAKGKKVWQDMQLLEVTQHTMESMRSRYLKVILPNIKSYNFSPHWVSLLTGNAADAQTGRDDNRGANCILRERPGEASPQHSQAPVSQSHALEGATVTVADDVDSASEDDFDTMLLNTAEDGKNQGRSSQVTLCSPRKRQGMDTEISLNNVSRVSTRKRQNVDTVGDKDSVNQTSPRKKQNVDTVGDKDSVNRTSPRKKQNVDNVGDKDSVNKTSPRKRQNVDTVGDKDSVNKTSPRKKQNVDTVGDKDSVNKTSPRKRHMDTVVEIDGLNKTSPRKRQNVDAVGDKDRVRRGPHRRKQTVEEERETTSRASSPDSYDQTLLMNGARMIDQLTQAFPTTLDKQLGVSTRRTSHTNQDLISQEKESEPTLLKGTKKHGADLQERVKKTGIKSLVNLLMKDSESTLQESSGSEPESDTSDGFADPDHIPEVAAQFGLTPDEMKYILYINSGQQSDAIHWIKFGCDTQGYPAWSETDDHTLQGTDHTSLAALQVKHGPQRILSRSLFLETAST